MRINPKPLVLVLMLLSMIGQPDTASTAALVHPSGGSPRPSGTAGAELRSHATSKLADAFAGSSDRLQLREPALALGTIDTELLMEIEDCLRDRAGMYGVAIRNLNTGQMALINADQPFLAASTYKLLVMYLAYQQMEEGSLSAEEELTIADEDVWEDEPNVSLYPGDSVTMADALEAMITVSNNAAAYALTRRLGGPDSIEAAAEDLGMYQTLIEEGYYWTTPLDMLTFFEKLAGGQLVSDEASRSMMGLLLRQKLNDFIPALLPGEASIAHKTGDLPGVRNDVGIVYGPAGRYVIGVFSLWADDEEAVNAIAEVSLKTSDYFLAEQLPGSS
ncbi:MAG: serine hydrolase [Dehalococcoidia bacterium]|nr:serine hydrolase [Dehalococcoidia bacterium]